MTPVFEVWILPLSLVILAAVGHSLWAGRRDILGEARTDATRLKDEIAYWRAAAGQVNRKWRPKAWANMHLRLATAIDGLAQNAECRAELEEAVAAYEDALTVFTIKRKPGIWVIIQHNLALALLRLDQLDVVPHQSERARDILQNLRTLCIKGPGRPHLPSVLTNLGALLCNTGQHQSDTAQLEDAVVVCRQAAETWNRKEKPEEWTKTRINLALALRLLGDRRGDQEILKEAANLCRDTLRCTSRKDAPANWAALQANLGGALCALAEHAGQTEGLEEALAAFDAGHDVWLRESEPNLWAACHLRRSHALRLLGELGGDPGRLKDSLDVCRLSLEIYTREDFPYNWAAAMDERGKILRAQGDRGQDTGTLEEAVAAHRASLAVVENLDAAHLLNEVRQNLAIAEAALQALRGGQEGQEKEAGATPAPVFDHPLSRGA